jgi:RNA 2',3'-cyclic 3'-phosphodiesterase
MRAFLALEIPEEVKAYLEGAADRMARRVKGVKWVKKEGLHITLKFFGEISEARAQEIRETLLFMEKEYSPVAASIKGVDAFPGRRRARVIVVTLGEGVEYMKNLFNDMEEGLLKLNIEPETRGYTPHITLGRVRDPAPLLEKDIEALEEKPFIVERAVFFQSKLTSAGAIYNPYWEIKLGGRA